MLRAYARSILGLCSVIIGSVLLVANVLSLCGIEGQVADRSNQRVNSERQIRQEEIRQRSGRIALRLQGRVVDYDASNEAQEKGEQESYKSVVIHGNVLQKNYAL